MDPVPTLIAGGFMVVGTLLGALVTYRFGLNIAKRLARQDAGRRLREAFEPELVSLYPGGEKHDIPGSLRTAFPRHHAAVLEFGFHITDPNERGRYDKAWRQYYERYETRGCLDYCFEEDGGLELFQKDVQAILEFTLRG